MEMDFSQDMVMRALGISRVKISTVFLEDIGMNFSQYVGGLRMDAFKQQLAQTDKQIKEIIRDIGYLDVSNFLRKFKTITGMTASQYRAIYRDKTKTHEDNNGKEET